MIRFVRDLLVELVLDPQADPEIVDVGLPEGTSHVAILESDDRPLDSLPQNLAVLSTTTTETGFSIGGGIGIVGMVLVGTWPPRTDSSEPASSVTSEPAR